MAENGNGKKWLTTVYTVLGIIVSSGIVFGCLWTAFAKPQVISQSRIEIRDWWDQSGNFVVDKMIDTRLEKKLEKIDARIDRIYQMNLNRLPIHERSRYEIADTIQ